MQKTGEEVIYTGLFVENVDSLKGKYPPVYDNEYYHHSTIAFRPKDGLSGLEVGEKKVIKIIGRVRSEFLDVLLVENPQSKNRNPHITLSTAQGIKPFQSNQEIEKAILNNTVIPVDDVVVVKVGYFNNSNQVITETAKK